MGLLTSFAVVFSAIFVVVDPIGAAPTFASLTAGRSSAEIRSIAYRASVVGAAVLAAFALVGGPVLDLLHIRLDAFRVAGGVLLLLMALDLLRGKGQSGKCSSEELAAAARLDDLAIVPVAVPLLAGPGSMATVMVLVAEGGLPRTAQVLAAVALTFLASYGALRAAGSLQRWTHPSVVAVVQRVLGLLLASLAIQFVADGSIGLLAG